jgi:hypothetical protein
MVECVYGLFQRAFPHHGRGERLTWAAHRQARQADEGALAPRIGPAQDATPRVCIQIFPGDSKYDRPDRHIELPEPCKMAWLLNGRRWRWKAPIGTGRWWPISTDALKTVAIRSGKNARFSGGTDPSGTSWIVTDMRLPLPRACR